MTTAVDPTPILASLRAILGDEGVLSGPEEVRVYECDAFAVARGVPTAVVFPRTTEQVAQCVGVLNKHDLQIVPRGSGTGLAGGAVAFGGGVLINTSRMTTIEKLDVENRVAIVQAGVLNTTLSNKLVGTGLHFSPDPSSQRASTLGGNAATNAGGINTLKHGVTTNHILGVEMVTADGNVLQVRPDGLYDGLGPDLPGLLCGSEGTLGIITRLWCRLTPKPKNFRTFYAVYSSTRDACKTVADVIAAGILPTSMEMMDGRMIQVVEDAFHYGFPRDAQALLLIEIDGVEEVLDEQMAVIEDMARQNMADDVQQCSDPKKRAELWSARKRTFGAIGRISHSFCTQDACVPRSNLPDVIEGIIRIGQEHGLDINNVFHAGDGNVHPIILFDDRDPAQIQNALACSERVLEFCIEMDGTITGEHGVGIEKLHLMPKMFNPDTIRTFQRIKQAFDPDQRINDGKLIPSDKTEIVLSKPMAAGSPGGAMAHA